MRRGPENSTRRRVSPALMVGISGVVIIGAVLIWRSLSGDTLEGAARRLLSCVERGDGACVFAMTHKTERKQLELTEDKVQKLLDTYVLPELKDAKRADGPYFQTFQENGWLLASQYYVGQNGKRFGVGFRVVITDDGVKAPLIVGELILSMAQARYGSDFNYLSSSTAKISAWEKAAINDGAMLEDIGITGFYRDNPPQFISWPDWAKNCRERIRMATKTP